MHSPTLCRRTSVGVEVPKLAPLFIGELQQLPWFPQEKFGPLPLRKAAGPAMELPQSLPVILPLNESVIYLKTVTSLPG